MIKGLVTLDLVACRWILGVLQPEINTGSDLERLASMCSYLFGARLSSIGAR